MKIKMKMDDNMFSKFTIVMATPKLDKLPRKKE
jgi:hypothetical protein